MMGILLTVTYIFICGHRKCFAIFIILQSLSYLLLRILLSLPLLINFYSSNILPSKYLSIICIRLTALVYMLVIFLNILGICIFALANFSRPMKLITNAKNALSLLRSSTSVFSYFDLLCIIPEGLFRVVLIHFSIA